MNLTNPNLALKIRFLSVGVVGFITNYLVLSICIGQGIHKVSGEVIAATVALQITFILHDKWTYLDKTSPLKLPLHRRYMLYIGSNSLGSVMTVLLFSGISRFVSLHILALAISASAAMVWNYLLNKFVIWRHLHSRTQILLESTER